MAQIDRDVYAQQLPRFEDPKLPDHCYKLQKVVSGMKQALRECYGTLSKLLEDSKFQRGSINPTLFRKNHNNRFIIVKIYIDYIIFNSTSKDVSDEFIELMKRKFRMSMMGELNYFQGLQVRQSPKGIFIGQEKYIKNLLKRYSMENASTAKTPMPRSYKLDSDLDGKYVYQKHYRGMIRSLLYLKFSRLDIMFSTCLYACFQANPNESHLMSVKRIFKYLKETTSLGLLYPAKCNYYLQAFTDSNYRGCKLNKKSISSSYQFLGRILYLFIKDNIQKGHIELHFVPTNEENANSKSCHLEFGDSF
uniref:Reverse transcriptase Ty1/copia-type domain-containing protein n=1 Tax=Lactuca sativa TaxID=4236 RepID=A0A9R1VCH6_LACSA|nr:hypothetical protein LSAT_V11C500245880 [Lactuca sativa]